MPLCGDARLRTNCLSYNADNVVLLARKTAWKGRSLHVRAELVEFNLCLERHASVASQRTKVLSARADYRNK